MEFLDNFFPQFSLILPSNNNTVENDNIQIPQSNKYTSQENMCPWVGLTFKFCWNRYDLKIQEQDFMHNSISNIDPNAIRNIQLNVKKSKKVITIKSILASLIVFALTVIISFESLENLWLDRSQMKFYQIKKYVQVHSPLSKTILCALNSNITSQRIPTISAFYNVGSTTINLFPIENSLIPQKYPYFMEYLRNGSYKCVDLTGANFSQFITINYDIPCRIFLKAYSIAEVILGKKQQILQLVPNRANYLGAIKFIFKDLLSSNYQPQITYGFSSTSLEVNFRDGTYNLSITIYDIKNNSVKGDNLIEYTIVRESLSEIIGKFLAWYSLLLALFMIAVRPIVEFALNLELAKKLYTHEHLNSVEPSLFVQMKFWLSACFPGCFQERIIHKAFKQIDIDMDIINLLRKQLMMGRISKELRFSEIQADLLIPNFQQENNIDKQLLQMDDNSNSSGDTPIQYKKSLFEAEEDQEQGQIAWKAIESILCSMDFSQTEVGLVYHKGAPYGSIWSIIITLLGITALLVFLILSGLLQIKEEIIQTAQMMERQDLIFNKTYTFQRTDFLIRILQHVHPLSRPQVNFYISNQFGELIQEVFMKRDNQCLDIQNALKVPANRRNFNYCLPPNITIYNSNSGRTYFRVFQQQLGPLPNLMTLQTSIFEKVVRFNESLFYEIFVERKIFNPPKVISTLTAFYEIHRVEYDDQLTGHKQKGILHFYGDSQERDTSGGGGFGIGLNQKVIKFTRKSSTIWDIMDSTWGITILCLQLFVIKISTIINKRLRDSKTKVEKEIQRFCIINILTNHNCLISGSFCSELNAVRYYFKENVSLSQNQN